MLALLGAAFLAGLVGSPHCVGMCGGFATACGGIRKGMTWHAGRLGTYAVLGALAGGFGAVLPGPGWIASVVSGILLTWFAAALAGLVPEPTLRIPVIGRILGRASGADGVGARLLLGISTGLLPCGLLWAALAIPVASGSPFVGAGAMVAFGVGTAPALLALTGGLRRLALHRPWARRVLAAGVLVLGLLSLSLRHGMAHGATP